MIKILKLLLIIISFSFTLTVFLFADSYRDYRGQIDARKNYIEQWKETADFVKKGYTICPNCRRTTAWFCVLQQPYNKKQAIIMIDCPWCKYHDEQLSGF